MTSDIHDLGVIGATGAANTPVSAPVPAGLGLPDITLPQWPAELPPIEPPTFTLARKEYDSDDHSPLLGAPHLPGAGGPGDPATTHAAAFGDPGSPLMGAVNSTFNDAHSALGAAQNTLDGVHTALAGGAPAAAAVQPAAVGSTTPAVAPTTAAPAATPAAAPVAIPQSPNDPVAALMNGLTLPAIPGMDALFQPFLDLLSSFGTGVLGALNPATLLHQTSQVIQAAMQIGTGALKSVEQVWQGQAAQAAQTAGQQTQAHGDDTAQRGFDISKLTDDASAVVKRGNVQLTQVAQSFIAQATALAPLALTPPGQASLISTATEYLGQAVTIVNATRGELSGYTGQLSGVVNQLLGTEGPQAAAAAQAVAQNIGQPIVEQAQQMIGSGGDPSSTQTAGLTLGNGTSTPGTPGTATTATTAAGYNGAHPGFPGLGTHTSVPGGPGGVPGGVRAIGLGGTPSGNTPAGPGASVPGVRGTPGLPGMPFGPGMPGSPGGTPTGASSFMGGAPGAAGQRNDQDEHSRAVAPYQSPTGNDDLTGPLGETTPEVIGQTHSDEVINDYDLDQL